MDAIFTLYALTAIRKSCETLKGIGLLMNDPHLAEQEGGSIITSLTNTIKDLRSRLAEVEKESKIWESRANGLDVDLAMLGNEIFKLRDELAIQWLKEADGIIEKLAKGEQTWGCGHTNHGSCSQCLGHVTNERNALRSKLEALDATRVREEK